MHVSKFLKLVFAADAINCLGMGTALAIGSGPLAPLFGLPQDLVLGAGLVLLPIGLFIAWIATRGQAPALFVWAIILGNAGWVIESLIVADTVLTITALGTAFVVAQAAAVAVLATLEVMGTLRAPKAPIAI